MKVTTTPRDCDKVNKIVPIMQEHLGPVMNLARIKLLAFVLHALCVVQAVSLHKIASAMPTSVERDSNLRRLQRFLAGYALNLDIIAKVIFALLPVKTGLVLSLDRTNWKFGEVNINILMLGVTHKGVAFPLLFTPTENLSASNGSSISTTDASDTTCVSSRIFGCVIPNPPRMSGLGICFTGSSSGRSVSTTCSSFSKGNMSILQVPC